MSNTLLPNIIPSVHSYTFLGSSPNNMPVELNLSNVGKRNSALVSHISKVNNNVNLNSKKNHAAIESHVIVLPPSIGNL